MFTKSKLSFLTLAAMFCVSSHAAEGDKFYVEVTDPSYSYILIFCEENNTEGAGICHHEQEVTFTDGMAQMIQLDQSESVHSEKVYLKKAIIKKGHHINVIEYAHDGTRACTVDLDEKASSTTHGHGYPLLILDYVSHGHFNKNSRLGCDNTYTYWAH